MELNAQTLGAGDAKAVPNSTPFIDQAIQRVYQAGGGEVILPAVPNGYNLYRLLGGPYVQVGGGIRLRKGVSLRGEGTKLLLRDNCAFITIASPKSQPAARLTITADLHAGDHTLTVDAARPVGTRVFLRCGNSGFEAVEPRYFGFATIVGSADATHVTLDKAVPADMAVASTNPVNRQLVVLDEVVEGVRIDGFDCINDMQGGANAESGIDLYMGRQIEVGRISGVNPGACLFGTQFCEDVEARQIHCRGSASQNGQLSKGRVLNLSGSTGVTVDGVSGENFERQFIFTEFFCQGIRLRNVRVANTFVGRNNDHTSLFFNQTSVLDVDGLTITGNGSYVFDDGGVSKVWGLHAVAQVRNLMARTNPVLDWPTYVPVDGYRMVA